MAAGEISGKRKWEKSKQALYSALKKEVGLMREILANLHQEELALLENSQRRFTKVMAERSDMVVQLKDLRESRIEVTQKLKALAPLLAKKEILALDEVETCDILTQLDQMVALIDRTNLQNCRNDHLFYEVQHKAELPLQCPYPHPLHEAQSQKRKTSVATYPPKP